jgi:hypothetical protein
LSIDNSKAGTSKYSRQEAIEEALALSNPGYVETPEDNPIGWRGPTPIEHRELGNRAGFKIRLQKYFFQNILIF